MRIGLVLLVVLTASLSGCTENDSDGSLFDFLTGGKELDGVCGHVFNEDHARQIIIEVVWTAETARRVDPTALEVTATYFGNKAEATARDAKPYAEKYVDSDNCVGFEVGEPGGYSFWAFAETDTPYCYVDGRLDGTFNGEEVVGGTLVIDRYFGADHC